MAQRHYLALSTGTVEVTDRVLREGWTTQEKAEEGAYGSWTVVLADPAMDLVPESLRAYSIVEDESEATDNVIFGGYTAAIRESRGMGEEDAFEPLGRVWVVEVQDCNSLWNRRVMVGTDCNRPAENDTARMAWLMSTSEAGFFDDVASYVSTATPTAMDKVPYIGQYLAQIVDDCAQATGKNWWAQRQETGAGRQNIAWYGKDSLTTYASTLFLSNDPADWDDATLLDGTSLVWPISEDTVLTSDPSRLYTGVYLTYAANKSIFRRNADVTDPASPVYGVYRDYVASYPNVKTKAKAIARATRLLADLELPNETISTTVELPKGKATMLRAGMRVPFKGTHLEGYERPRWVRVLSCAATPVAAGARYRLALELQGPGASIPYSRACALIDTPVTGSQTFPINGSGTTVAPGNVFYKRPGIDTPIVPTIGHEGTWHFPAYSVLQGSDYVDAAGDAVQNRIRFVVAGPGTLEVLLTEYSGDGHVFLAELWYGTEIDDFHWKLAHQTIESLTFTIPDDEHCYHWIEVGDDGDATGGKWAYKGAIWTPL